MEIKHLCVCAGVGVYCFCDSYPVNKTFVLKKFPNQPELARVSVVLLVTLTCICCEFVLTKELVKKEQPHILQTV